MRGNKAVYRLTKPKLLSLLARGATAGTMEKLLKVLVAHSFLLIGGCKADPQAQYQFRLPAQINAQSRNFIQNTVFPQKAATAINYPPFPRRQILGENRNFIPNRFDVPAGIIEKKPASYAGPYGQQGYPKAPLVTPQGAFPADANYFPQQTAAAMTAKANLLAMAPGKKIVPHLPPMGRHQLGKPPYVPAPRPIVPMQPPGFAVQGVGVQPLGYKQPGMIPPPPATFGQSFHPGGEFGAARLLTAPAPLPQQPHPHPAFPVPQPQYNQVLPPFSVPQHDEPQVMNAAPLPPTSFQPEMSQSAPYGQQMLPSGSFDMAKKNMVAWRAKAQTKRFGIPRPVIRSRLAPRPLYI